MTSLIRITEFVKSHALPDFSVLHVADLQDRHRLALRYIAACQVVDLVLPESVLEEIVQGIDSSDLIDDAQGWIRKEKLSYSPVTSQHENLRRRGYSLGARTTPKSYFEPVSISETAMD